MNTPRSLTDAILLTRVQALSTEERRITLELLQHLREIDRRKLHLERGFGSLFDYLVKELRYSEGAAYRRLQAMRALQDLPEIAPAIESGSISLTTVAQVQSFLQTEKKERGTTYSLEQKRELFTSIENRSKREVEEVLVAISPSYESRPSETTRAIAPELTQISFVADQELMDLLAKLKSLTSHSDPDPSYLDLFKRIARTALTKLDPAREPSRKVASPANESARHTRKIPAQTRRVVWRRDQARCTYEDPQTGRVCGSTHLPQLDHRQPWALGGSHTSHNLRVLCAHHNRHHARKIFGELRNQYAIPALTPAVAVARAPSPSTSPAVEASGPK